MKSEKVRFEMANREENAAILRKLVEFLKGKGQFKYDVVELIFAQIKGDQLHIKGSLTRPLPQEFLEALGIKKTEQLTEALNSVPVFPRVGEGPSFSATFLITPFEGGE